MISFEPIFLKILLFDESLGKYFSLATSLKLALFKALSNSNLLLLTNKELSSFK